MDTPIAERIARAQEEEAYWRERAGEARNRQEIAIRTYLANKWSAKRVELAIQQREDMR